MPDPLRRSTESAGLTAEGARQRALRWLRDHAATPRTIVGEPLESSSAWAFRVETDAGFGMTFGLLVVDKFDAYMEQWQPDEDGDWPEAYEARRPARVSSQRELETGSRRLRRIWWLACTALQVLLVAALIILTVAGALGVIVASVLIAVLSLVWAYALTLFGKAVDRLRGKERSRLLEGGERRGWPT